MIRRDERLTPVAAGRQTRKVDFGEGPRLTMSIPWGDVSTAYHSTGIPNIEVYMAASPWLVRTSEFSQYAAWLMRCKLTRHLVMRGVRTSQPGPTPMERQQGKCQLWGMVRDEKSGKKIVARMQTPEGYTLTAHASLAMVERVLAGDAPAGYRTPSSAYGADFVLELDGVTRMD